MATGDPWDKPFTITAPNKYAWSGQPMNTDNTFKIRK